MHEIPYFSQFASADLAIDFVTDTKPLAEDPRWAESGASTAKEYAFWAQRACGMACLRMILAFRGIPALPLVPLAEECTRYGGYVRHDGGQVKGLIYEPFVRWIAVRFTIRAEVRREFPISDVAETIHDGNVAMLSVHPWLRWPSREPPHRGGHLVLAVGADEDHLIVHNPSGVPRQSQTYAHVPWVALERFYAGRGIIILP